MQIPVRKSNFKRPSIWGLSRSERRSARSTRSSVSEGDRVQVWAENMGRGANLTHWLIFTQADALREQLQSEGIVFRSQTDTEVIAQLIGRELDAQPDIELRDAVSRSLQKCEGTWGVAVLSVKDPDSVVVACNGSPMNIGLAPGKTFIASETSAFNRHTKNFIAMSDLGVPRRCGAFTPSMRLVSISQ